MHDEFLSKPATTIEFNDREFEQILEFADLAKSTSEVQTTQDARRWRYMGDRRHDKFNELFGDKFENFRCKMIAYVEQFRPCTLHFDPVPENLQQYNFHKTMIIPVSNFNESHDCTLIFDLLADKQSQATDKPYVEHIAHNNRSNNIHFTEFNDIDLSHVESYVKHIKPLFLYRYKLKTAGLFNSSLLHCCNNWSNADNKKCFVLVHLYQNK